MRVAAFERDLIVDALKRHAGNAAAAARELGTTSRIIRYRVRVLGISMDEWFGKIRRP